MLLLPPILDPLGGPRVPLLDETAVRLEQLLLEPSTELRRRKIVITLGEDGLFAGWALVAVGEAGADVPGSVAALGERLLERVVERLSGLTNAADSAPLAATSLDLAQTWRAASRRRAGRQRANQQFAQWAADPAYLATLLAEFGSVLADLAGRPPDEVRVVVPEILAPAAERRATKRKTAGRGPKKKRPAAKTAARRQADPWTIVERLPQLVATLARWERELWQQKLDAMKELAYGASHEINNPLANIAARADTLIIDEAAPERKRALAAIHSQAMRAHDMIADLMLFARPPAPVLARVDIGQSLRDVVATFAEQTESRRIEVACEQRSKAAILCDADPTQLAVAFSAILRNACEAIGQDGKILIHLRRVKTVDGASAEIAFTDTGPGLCEAARQHLFDPFFSGREAGRGLGFGLSKCWRIVTTHGGRIAFSSPPGSGATFTLTLPCRRSKAAAK